MAWMKESLKAVGGVFLVLATLGGFLAMIASTQYEFRYHFESITLDTRSGDVVRVLGEPEGKVQSLVIVPSQDARDSYTNTVTYQADSYLFWRQSSVTYYVGFNADDTATMTVVRTVNGGDHICQVKGRERNKYRLCTRS
jgi:hypothetical protein